jgi:RNA polymerase sigma-70 factor (ECF subfamily)
VRRYQDLAMRTAYLVAPEADAADAVQEGFLKAYAALARFREGAPFRPWLLRIVTNQALNFVEAKQARLRMTERYTQQIALASDPPSPEFGLLQQEQGRRLLQAVQALTPTEQALIGLRYFLEMPEAEVAEALRIPKGTVKSRLHRTLARLRQIIGRDYPELSDRTGRG